MNIGLKDIPQSPMSNDTNKVPKIEFPKNEDGINSKFSEPYDSSRDLAESKGPSLDDWENRGEDASRIEITERTSLPDTVIKEDGFKKDEPNLHDVINKRESTVPDLLILLNDSKDNNGLTAEQKIRIKTELELPDDFDRIVDRFNNYEQYERFSDDINSSKEDMSLDEDDFDEKGWQYDDNGEPYAYDGVLLPNSEYDLNGYHYKTDGNGRVVEVSGTLKLKTHDGRKPLSKKMDDIAWGDQREGDERGHLIADRFDGSNDISNLTAQNKDVNKKEVRSFEDQLAKEVEAGKKVEVKITVVYEGDSNRPSAYIYDCKIDGKPVKKIFKNEASGK